MRQIKHEIEGLEVNMNYSSYIELKKRKAKEQGKTWWFEAMLTDEEAHLRISKGPPEESSCNFCKLLLENRSCSLGHNITNCLSQICDEWKYCF